jgi:hypothetical protein
VYINVVVPSTLWVMNSNDAGAGSLRQAMLYANANSSPGNPDLIAFNIPTTDPGYSSATAAFTISPLSALPAITNPLVLDGTTQPGSTSTPVVVLNGSQTGAADGLDISAGNTTVKGVCIRQRRRRRLHRD